MNEIVKLDQSRFSKGKRSFTLHSDGTLTVFSSYLGQSQEFSVDVAHLNPKPSRESALAWKLLIGCLILVLGMFFLIFGAIAMRQSPDEMKVFIVFACITGFVSLLAFWELKRRSYDVFCFNNLYTGQQLNIMATTPTEGEVKKFIDKLIEQINIQREPLGQHGDSLLQNLKELGRLKESGVITESEFEKLKGEFINSAKVDAKIGF